MNIFYLSHKPSRCARWHCDKHVVKMILETTQLLYTAHWVLALAASAQPDFTTAPSLVSDPKQKGYKSIRNPKHPCAIWTRESLQHYYWLCELGMALCEEYIHRFSTDPADPKSHACEEHIYWLYSHPPPTLKDTGWRQPAQAMPDEYKHGSSIAAYRAYYRLNKGDLRGMLTYTARHKPHWLGGPLNPSPGPKSS
jgi:hypothetical protein